MGHTGGLGRQISGHQQDHRHQVDEGDDPHQLGVLGLYGDDIALLDPDQIVGHGGDRGLLGRHATAALGAVVGAGSLPHHGDLGLPAGQEPPYLRCLCHVISLSYWMLTTAPYPLSLSLAMTPQEESPSK